jgi:hypothetical protein
MTRTYNLTYVILSFFFQGTENCDDLDKVMSDISDKVSFIDLSVIKRVSEDDGCTYWIMVNRSIDEFAKLNSSYKHLEMFVLKKTVCCINSIIAIL